MPTVANTEKDPAGNPQAGARVRIKLIASSTGEAPGYVPASDYSILGEYTTRTDTGGAWTSVLTANPLISPANTYYIADIEPKQGRAIRHIFSVPDGAGPYRVEDILTDPPANLPDLHQTAPTGAHAASAVSFAPAGGIAATNAQAALVELDAEALHKAGTETVTGTKLFAAGRPWIDIEPGPTAGAGTDDALTVMAAIAALPSPSGGRIRMTAPAYRFKTKVTWDDRCVEIKGGGSGSQPGTGTTVTCDAGVTAFNPRNGTLARGAGSAIKGLRIVGTDTAATPTATVTNKALTSNVATLTTAAAHGFVAGNPVVVENVDGTFNGTWLVASTPTTTSFTFARTAANVASVAATGTASSFNCGVLMQANSGQVIDVRAEGFGGYGVAVLSSTATTGTFGEINANNCRLDMVKAYSNYLAGVYTRGTDSNACTLTGIDCGYNGTHGIWEGASLGNHWMGIHLAGNVVGGIRIGPGGRSRMLGVYYESQNAPALTIDAGSSGGNIVVFSNCARPDNASPIVDNAGVNFVTLEQNILHQSRLVISGEIAGEPKIDFAPALVSMLLGAGLKWNNPADTANWTATAQDTSLDLVLNSAQGGSLNVNNNGVKLGKFLSHKKINTAHAGGALALAVNTGNIQRITLTGSITSLTITSPTDGQVVTLEFKQDATGGRTVTFASNFKLAGAAFALTGTANGIDSLTLRYDSGTGFLTEVSRAMNIPA